MVQGWVGWVGHAWCVSVTCAASEASSATTTAVWWHRRRAHRIQRVDQVPIYGGLLETLLAQLGVLLLHGVLPLLLHELLNFRGDLGRDIGVAMARLSADEHPQPLAESTHGGREEL